MKPAILGRYRALIFGAILLAAVALIFPAVLGPSVNDPLAPFPDNPFSLTARIVNEYLTPFTNLEYSCESADVVLANGTPITDAKILNQGKIRKLPGRRAFNARCETAYIVNAPVKSAEFKLKLTYKAFPWPQLHTHEYDFTAVVDAHGQVAKWSRK